MIIKYTDGKELNTDALPDVDAMIHEKVEELRLLCRGADRQFLILFDGLNNLRSKQFVSCQHFKDSDLFMRMIGSFIHSITDGRYELTEVPQPPPTESYESRQ